MRPRRPNLTRTLTVLLAFVAAWAVLMGVTWLILGGR
jgi:hypothetical protein